MPDVMIPRGWASMREPENRYILVTGGTGQIGIELGRLNWPSGTTIHAPDRSDCDITSPLSIDRAVGRSSYSCVINCAGWTAVDAAEKHVSEAFRANTLGPAWLAEATCARNIPLIHVSTDYVFSGALNRPYDETDQTAPNNIYGISKLAGERAVLAANPRAVILRTAWLLSAHRGNFLKTMLRLGGERDRIGVVTDQIGCPTAAADVAVALQSIALRMITDATAPTGIYHFVNRGEASWHELATAIFATAASLGGPCPQISPLTSDEYPTPAKRPANSRLQTARIGNDYGIAPRPWRDAVAEIVREILSPLPQSAAMKGNP